MASAAIECHQSPTGRIADPPQAASLHPKNHFFCWSWTQFLDFGQVG